LGLSISTISNTEILEDPVPVSSFVTENDEEMATKGSEVNVGGGASNETGWFPNKFFSKPVCMFAKKSK